MALTLGNHPSVDLMVISSQGNSLNIDVKGRVKHRETLDEHRIEARG